MSTQLELFLITKSADVAAYAERNGVDVIFLDLEILGKEERQGHKDTVISRHSWSDVGTVRNAVSTAQLMVRMDPPHANTPDQVRRALDAGADRLMLPMFNRAKDIEDVDKILQGRKMLVPLVETMPSLLRLEEYAGMDCIRRVHLGLNDLHLQCGLTFLFEGLTGGLADLFSQKSQRVKVPFGIGGVARLGTGGLKAERILGEHARLGSTAMILSRAFHGGADDLSAFKLLNVQAETDRVRKCYADHLERTPLQVEADRLETQAIVARLIREQEEGASK